MARVRSSYDAIHQSNAVKQLHAQVDPLRALLAETYAQELAPALALAPAEAQADKQAAQARAPAQAQAHLPQTGKFDLLIHSVQGQIQLLVHERAKNESAYKKELELAQAELNATSLPDMALAASTAAQRAPVAQSARAYTPALVAEADADTPVQAARAKVYALKKRHINTV